MVAESAIADGMGGNPSNNVQTALIKPGASTAPTATVTGSRQESVAGPRLAVGPCPTIDVNQTSPVAAADSSNKSLSNGSHNSTSAKSSSPLFKHVPTKGGGGGIASFNQHHNQRHLGLQRSASEFSPPETVSTFDAQSIRSGRPYRNGRRLTTTLAAANPSAIPVLCGSCSNLSVLNLVDTMPMYGENHHAAGAVVPFYDPHGPVSMMPQQHHHHPSMMMAPHPYAVSNAANNMRRHSSAIYGSGMVPAEYGNNHHNFFDPSGGGGGGRGTSFCWPSHHLPPAPAGGGYFYGGAGGMGGGYEPMDYESFKRAMINGGGGWHRSASVAAGGGGKKKKLVDDGNSSSFYGGGDGEELGCAQLCCGDAAKVLWAIIAIVCFGFLAALLSALYLF